MFAVGGQIWDVGARIARRFIHSSCPGSDFRILDSRLFSYLDTQISTVTNTSERRVVDWQSMLTLASAISSSLYYGIRSMT